MPFKRCRMRRIQWQYVILVLGVCLSIHLLGNLVVNNFHQRLNNTDMHKTSPGPKTSLIQNKNSVVSSHYNQEILNSANYKSNSTKNIGILFYNKPSWMSFESTVIDTTRCSNIKQELRKIKGSYFLWGETSFKSPREKEWAGLDVLFD